MSLIARAELGVGRGTHALIQNIYNIYLLRIVLCGKRVSNRAANSTTCCMQQQHHCEAASRVREQRCLVSAPLYSVVCKPGERLVAGERVGRKMWPHGGRKCVCAIFIIIQFLRLTLRVCVCSLPSGHHRMHGEQCVHI